MQKYDVSIIVPVYNREEIIKPCIESINSQTYDKSKWEVIFIDDASTDNSIDTIETLIDKSINYRILRRPVGSGNASAPRNEGIKASLSKYVFFLDSDDYVDHQLLENGMAMALRNDSDIVYVKMKGIGRNTAVRPFKIKFVDNADVQKNHLIRFLSIFKFYKVDLLIKNSIFFPPNVSVAEDQIFTVDALVKSDIVSIVADKDYYFLQGHGNDHLSKKRVPLENFFRVIEYSLSSIYFSNLDFDKKSKFYNAWIIRAVERFVGLCKTRKIDNKENIEMFKLSSSYFNIKRELFDLSQIYDNEKVLTLLFLAGDFKEFYKMATESKILQSIESAIKKKFNKVPVFNKSWVYKNKVVVLDFIIGNNKIAFDLEVDEKKKSLKVWMFSRNQPDSLNHLHEKVIKVEKNKLLIFDGVLNSQNKAIDDIREYLNKIRS